MSNEDIHSRAFDADGTPVPPGENVVPAAAAADSPADSSIADSGPSPTPADSAPGEPRHPSPSWGAHSADPAAAHTDPATGPLYPVAEAPGAGVPLRTDPSATGGWETRPSGALTAQSAWANPSSYPAAGGYQSGSSSYGTGTHHSVPVGRRRTRT